MQPLWASSMLCPSMASPLLCPPLQNKSRFPPRLLPRFHGLPAPRPATLLRRNGLLSPNEETVEALTGFLRCPDSPWALPPDCSPAEQQLRELAVLCPQIVRTGFVCCYFRSLRIVNKGVSGRALLTPKSLGFMFPFFKMGLMCQQPPLDSGLMAGGGVFSSFGCAGLPNERNAG